MDPGFAGRLLYHAAIVQAEWSETLRYKPVNATDAELQDVFQSVDWVAANYHALWS